jgi:hypothetical protein
MKFLLRPKTAGAYRLFSVIAEDAIMAIDLARGLIERGCDEVEISGVPDDAIYSIADLERMSAEVIRQG